MANATIERPVMLEDSLIDSYLTASIKVMASMKMPEGVKYTSIEALVLDKGLHPDRTPFTPAEERFLSLLFAEGRKYRVRSCYQNATNLVWQADAYSKVYDDAYTIEYGEGFAYNGLIPTLHGVMLLNGKPVDLTYRKDMFTGNNTRSVAGLLKRARWCQQNVDYRLVHFTRDQMDSLLLPKGTYGLIDDWTHHFPLLRDGVPDAA